MENFLKLPGRMTRTHSKNRKKAAGLKSGRKFLFLLPGLTGVAFFVLAPFVRVLASSFYTALSEEFAGVQNYVAVFENTAFRLAVANTIRFMAAGIPLLLLLSLGLALMIGGNPRRDKYKYLYLLPMAMPAATLVFVWKMLFAKQGFLNGIRGSFTDFMGEDSSFYILLASYLWKNLGYTLVLWIAGLKAMPADIIDAAKVDGAGRIKRFLHVTLPNLKGSVYTILVVSLLNSFKVFREVYLVGGAYPQEKIYLLQHVFNNWYTNLDFDKMAAGAVLSVLVLGSISLLLQRLWNGEE